MKASSRAIAPIAILMAMLIVGILLPSPVVEAQGASCQVAKRSLPLAGIAEASGVAASRRTAGLLWSHNDSGEPMLFAVSADGGVKGSIRVTGAQGGDWEAVAVGRCPQGSCVYIGDIGDNGGKRKDVTIYRVPEPAAAAKETATAESMRATYPDGPQDAEAMFVLPGGAVYIVTKGESGPVALYRLPQFRSGASAQLARVATVLDANADEGKGGRKGKGKNGKGKKSDNGNSGVPNSQKVTDAGASPDGRWIALRTHDAITFFAASELTAGKVREAFRYDVSGLGEAQGEGVALGANGVVWLTSEGGGKAKPGTLARLSCKLP